MQNLSIYRVIERAERSAASVQFKTDTGLEVVSARVNDVLTFTTPAGTFTQAGFFDRYRHALFDIEGETSPPDLVDDPEGDDGESGESGEFDSEIEFPEADGAVAWSAGATDAELKAYLVEIAGEAPRNWARQTMLDKVARFIETGSTD